jgi:hypothetical protein
MENPLCRLSRDIKSPKAASIPLFVFGMSKAPVILEIAYVPLKTVIGASQIFMNVVRLASAPTLRSLKKRLTWPSTHQIVQRKKLYPSCA